MDRPRFQQCLMVDATCSRNLSMVASDVRHGSLAMRLTVSLTQRKITHPMGRTLNCHRGRFCQSPMPAWGCGSVDRMHGWIRTPIVPARSWLMAWSETRPQTAAGCGKYRSNASPPIGPPDAKIRPPLCTPESLTKSGHPMLLSLNTLARPARTLVVTVCLVGLYLAITDRVPWSWLDYSLFSIPASEPSFCKAEVWAERGQWRRKQGLECFPLSSFGADV